MGKKEGREYRKYQDKSMQSVTVGSGQKYEMKVGTRNFKRPEWSSQSLGGKGLVSLGKVLREWSSLEN